jgi:hypothetical protein
MTHLMSNGVGDMVKVQFYDTDVGYENLWATPVEGDLYRLESVPYFIYNISLGDLVSARPNEQGRLQFVQLVMPSGNRTLRARPEDFTIVEARGRHFLTTLKSYGCDIEVLEPRLIAIGVPKETGLDAITEFLTAEGVPWEYANPAMDDETKN